MASNSSPCGDSLDVALKEWAVVVGALREGRQLLLLRKGGIHESAGEFEVEHRRFLLFPTYLHQSRTMLKAAEQDRFVPAATEPQRVELSTMAEVTDILQLKNPEQMERIDDEHLWAKPLIDMRFQYRPENPLYLLLVRAWGLDSPVTVENTPAYAGCKSWVKLEQGVPVAGATAVLDDAEYARRRDSIVARVG